MIASATTLPPFDGNAPPGQSPFGGAAPPGPPPFGGAAPPGPAPLAGNAPPGLRAGAMLAVLGVVYGDIGTSPLYALKAALTPFAGDGLAREEVLGILSLVLWSLILVVTVKYVALILRADNRGEGGILALTALAQGRVGADVQGRASGARTRWTVALIGMAGAALFFGDGIITPAISVLSAVEGLKVVSPAFEGAVLPISIAIILALFLVQYRGTGAMGAVFGPICALWFLAIGGLGAAGIAAEPGVLAALSPTHAIAFATGHGTTAFVAFGAVFLAVTGAEALYADLGHFGRKPIARMWTLFVLPALVLNYFGQGALLIGDPAAIENPFYLLAPEALRLPLVFLAAAATVIASQAVISGAYSLARQCVQLGFLPRLTVRHTSGTEAGQIYMPQVNVALLLGVVALVLAFGTSDNLAAAYGIAVTGTFICTTLLAMLVFHRVYAWSWALVVPVFAPLLALDLVFFASNALKIPEGGWMPLALGAALLVLMTTWRQGRGLLFARLRADSLPLASFLARLPQSRTQRVPGIAVFMTGQGDAVPGALLHSLKHYKVLHERVLFVTVTTEDIPAVPAAERASVEELGPGIHRVSLRYGFGESPDVPAALAGLPAQGIAWDPMQASFFLGRETVVRATLPKLPAWRQWLFGLMARNATPATEFFAIPADRVVELGVRVAI